MKKDKKKIQLRASLPYFQFWQEPIVADTLASIAKIELIAKQGSKSISKLIPYIGDHSAVVGATAINHLKKALLSVRL